MTKKKVTQSNHAVNSEQATKAVVEAAAYAYRLRQAEELLKGCGFVEVARGQWKQTPERRRRKP